MALALVTNSVSKKSVFLTNHVHVLLGITVTLTGVNPKLNVRTNLTVLTMPIVKVVSVFPTCLVHWPR
jgi:hypothetical protein